MVDIGKIIIKFIWKSKNNFEKEKHIEGSGSIPIFKMTYQVIETVVVIEGQTHRTEDPEIDLYKYAQMTFDKGIKTIHWRQDPF